MSVDLPSSTLPQVLRRRMSTTGTGAREEERAEEVATTDMKKGWVGGRILEITGFLAVFHGGLGSLVVGAGAAFGDAGGGDLADDVIDGAGRAFHHAGADHVGDGANAADHGLARFGWLRPGAGVGIGPGGIRMG